ncbi:MAG: hypothetical protein OXN25_11265 [Candidatus Poribacteria bacterium]|nr:hypothetical protein [Candidatus Poribacteria bacterium]
MLPRILRVPSHWSLEDAEPIDEHDEVKQTDTTCGVPEQLLCGSSSCLSAITVCFFG